MPFYEYECSSCKFYTEVMQKITDAPLRKCPSCGKSTMKKLVSAPVFRLKGGGWYETDFKSDKEAKRNLAGAEKAEAAEGAKEAAKEAPKEAAKSEAKGDTKPAAAKEPAGKPRAATLRPRAKRAARPARKSRR